MSRRISHVITLISANNNAELTSAHCTGTVKAGFLLSEDLYSSSRMLLAGISTCVRFPHLPSRNFYALYSSLKKPTRKEFRGKSAHANNGYFAYELFTVGSSAGIIYAPTSILTKQPLERTPYANAERRRP